MHESPNMVIQATLFLIPPTLKEGVASEDYQKLFCICLCISHFLLNLQLYYTNGSQMHGHWTITECGLAITQNNLLMENFF